MGRVGGGWAGVRVRVGGRCAGRVEEVRMGGGWAGEEEGRGAFTRWGE